MTAELLEETTIWKLHSYSERNASPRLVERPVCDVIVAALSYTYVMFPSVAKFARLRSINALGLRPERGSKLFLLTHSRIRIAVRLVSQHATIRAFVELAF